MNEKGDEFAAFIAKTVSARPKPQFSEKWKPGRLKTNEGKTSFCEQKLPKLPFSTFLACSTQVHFGLRFLRLFLI